MALDLNLLPEEVRLAQLRARHLRRWAVSSVPLLAVMSILAAFDAVRSVKAADLHEQATAVTHRVAARRAEVKKLGEELAEATLRLSRSDALRSKRNWSRPRRTGHRECNRGLGLAGCCRQWGFVAPADLRTCPRLRSQFWPGRSEPAFAAGVLGIKKKDYTG